MNTDLKEKMYQIIDFKLGGNYETKMEVVNEILALQQPLVINCATCKHQEVSKYVEPCYGCNDYSNHQIKGGIVL